MAFHKIRVKIAKEVGDTAEEARAYENVGKCYHGLGEVQKALDYHELQLKTAKEEGERAVEGRGYGNMGNCYHSHGEF